MADVIIVKIIFSLSTGIFFSVLVSFSDSFSYRILEAYYRKNRKKIINKWQFIFQSRSYCENCKTPISTIYLIPILGSLFNSFQCSTCHKKISKRFFIEESFAFLVGCIIYILHPNLSYILFSGIYFIILYIISRIDFEFLLIPTEAILFFLIVSLLELLFFRPEIYLYTFLNQISIDLLAGFTWYVIFHLLRILSGYKMGLADVRLILPLSFAIGFPKSLFLPTIASVLGIIYFFSLWFISYQKKNKIQNVINQEINKNTKLPFGLFLSLSFFILRLWK